MSTKAGQLQVHQGLDALRYGLSILAAALPTASIDVERGREQAGADFIGSAQLVNRPVATHQAGWRQAEQTCFDPAALVATRGDSGPAPDAVTSAIAAQRSAIAM